MTPTFRRTAAYCGMLTASAGLIYTVSFAIFVREGSRWAQWASSVTLLIGALLSLPVIIAVYSKLRAPEPQFAILGVIAAAYGAYGAASHAAFDIAVLVNPVTGSAELPSQVDPRGFATFAATGLALAIFGGLILRVGGMPRAVGVVAVAGSACLIVVYLGRLIALDPNTASIKPFAVLYGLILGPLYYLLIARALWSAPTTADQLAAAPASAPVADPASVSGSASASAPASGSAESAPAAPAVVYRPASHAPDPAPAPAAATARPDDSSPDETVILRDRGGPISNPNLGRV
jgi:hypothetical protein